MHTSSCLLCPCRSVIQSVSFADRGFGMDWIAFVELWLNQTPVWFRDLWFALKEHYKKDPRQTLAHGDCRPGTLSVLLIHVPLLRPANAKPVPSAGNLLFPVEGEGGGVVFTDWEVMAITPFMWDLPYMMAMGMRIPVRTCALEHACVALASAATLLLKYIRVSVFLFMLISVFVFFSHRTSPAVCLSPTRTRTRSVTNPRARTHTHTLIPGSTTYIL